MQISHRLKKLEDAAKPPEATYEERQRAFWEKVREKNLACPHDNFHYRHDFRPYLYRESWPGEHPRGWRVRVRLEEKEAQRGHCHQCGAQDFYWDISKITPQETLRLSMLRFDHDDDGDDFAYRLMQEGRLALGTAENPGVWLFGGKGVSFESMMTSLVGPETTTI